MRRACLQSDLFGEIQNLCWGDVAPRGNLRAERAGRRDQSPTAVRRDLASLESVGATALPLTPQRGAPQHFPI